MNKNLKTKIIFVSFLIANISLSLGNVCADCCECCKNCCGEKVLTEEEKWNKTVEYFSKIDSNKNPFYKDYKHFNVFYDNVIQKIKEKKFDEIRSLYKKKFKEIKKELKIQEYTCDENNIYKNEEMEEKKPCSTCYNDGNNVYLIKHNNQNNYYCEECVKNLNYNLFLKPVCIPRFTLLLQNNKYFVLKISVLTVFVDKDDNLFIRGDWEDESNYTTDNYYGKNSNKNNMLFSQILENDDTVFVFNFNKENVFSNKSHIYLLLGSVGNDNNFVFPEDSFNINSFMNNLKEIDSYTYFSYCFHLLFSLIYSGILFFIDNDSSCFKGCSKICINGLHFFYDFYKKDHGSIEALLNIDKFDEKKVFSEDYKINQSLYFFKQMSEYFLALRTRAFDESCGSNFLDSRRENILNLSKSLLNSIKKGFTEGFSNNSIITEAKPNE